MKKLIFIVSLIVASVSSATIGGASAIRLPGENYEQAAFRTQNFSPNYYSAQSAAKPLAHINISELPEVSSLANLTNEFEYIRDLRFIKKFDAAQFLRRITWLYPDDGCYARAEMAKFILEKHSFPAPKKLFVFGNLMAKTKNAAAGYVTWWYHVAVAYRVQNTGYVFDPAINPERPLTVNEWNQAVGGQQTHVRYAICDKDTFYPNDSCTEPYARGEDSALFATSQFLDAEWYRLISLKRNPEQELGEFPPWKAR